MPYSIAHVYISKKVCNKKQFILGSILPDVTLLITRDRKHILMKNLVKKLEKDGKVKYLAAGIKSHIFVDEYMHKNYVIKKAKIISNKFNVPIDMGHAAVETCMDKMLLKRYPSLAKSLIESIKSMEKEDIVYYLEKVLKHDKLKRAVKDSYRIGILKKPYSTRSIIFKLITLIKYRSLKSSNIKIRKIYAVMKEANELIKNDYNKYLNNSVKIVREKVIKNL
ncbi:zinc dependent phospholipase C family protein [Candidatus Woesearchaeota archaeon]|nr:zinc dependent phospholipase C family protein [Candidatus Woesearchaeota archaeon]